MSEKNYEIESVAAAQVAAPVFAYEAPSPKGPVPKIGLIGCGGITEHHLQAYKAAGWEVAAFHDAHPPSALKRRDAFYPQAIVCGTIDELLETPGIEVVDIATHPGVRAPLIERAIATGKHILSQKPFVTNLEEGERLVSLAKAAGVKLAVNQNGRWAPYFSYMRHAIRAGLIGEVGSVHIAIEWDHTWTAGTAFEEIHHLVLYDFGIHWFDAACSFFDSAAVSVQAVAARFPGQPVKPPLLASATAAFPQGIATLVFNACNRFGPLESCTVVGTKGTLRAAGPVCAIPSVELTTAEGSARADLLGSWFPDGFRGAMGELLCAIEENREPENSAAANLNSLALCFAAMKAADEERTVTI
jgi:predicted dehydrogenase